MSTATRKKKNFRSFVRNASAPGSQLLATAGYGRPYVVVSPVLIPCIQTSVNMRTKSKKGKKLQQEIKFVSALTYTTVSPYTYFDSVGNQIAYPCNITSGSDCSRFDCNYPVLSSENSNNQQSFSTAATKHTLNPLSRPYTPSSLANKIEMNSCNHSDGTDNERHDTDSSVSRQSSPIMSACPYCREARLDELSDADSGVGVESEDEGWCCCDVDFDDADDWLDELYIRLRTVLTYSFPKSTVALLNFLCDNLASHEWRAVARELGVNDVVIQNADYEEFEDFHQKMRSVLMYWAKSKQSCSFKQKYLAIERSLCEIGRTDLVNEIQTKRNALERA